ncbi:MAG: hypothetical protein ABIS23_04615 [Sphingomicrobium sp.]
MSSLFKPTPFLVGNPESAHDSAYFQRRAAAARRAACSKVPGENFDVAGELALAYAALARRRRVPEDEAV